MLKVIHSNGLRADSPLNDNYSYRNIYFIGIGSTIILGTYFKKNWSFVAFKYISLNLRLTFRFYFLSTKNDYYCGRYIYINVVSNFVLSIWYNNIILVIPIECILPGETSLEKKLEEKICLRPTKLISKIFYYIPIRTDTSEKYKGNKMYILVLVP